MPLKFVISALLFNINPFAICASIGLLCVVFVFKAPANVLGTIMIGVFSAQCLKFVFSKYLSDLVQREVSRDKVVTLFAKLPEVIAVAYLTVVGKLNVKDDTQK